MANATANEIQDQAIVDGMVTMQLDGIIKALRGETTIEEVLRVTREQ
jgi:type II secretory ATPase GspE/PulE/Tfp pilus assembly ATPase PilB-like protein